MMGMRAFFIFFDGFLFDCNEIDGLLLPFLFFWVGEFGVCIYAVYCGIDG